jgi:hypothetical protein
MKRDKSTGSDSCGTKIVLKCKQILKFKHIKRKDEKKYQQGANWCTLGTI